MKASLYLETTIVSYLVARPSRDVFTLTRQQATDEWWSKRSKDFDIVISDVVLDEASAGDPEPAKQRIALLKPFSVLEATTDAQELAKALIGPGLLPKKAVRDAAHLAIASTHGIHFLLTWNFRHIANAEILENVERVCEAHGSKCPVVCTPEELMGVE